MYSNDDFKFYFDSLSDTRDKVNLLEDNIKELAQKLPFEFRGKVDLVHSQLCAVRNTLWLIDQVVEKIKDGDSS